MTRTQKIKRYIVKRFFKDVMNSSSRIYLEYNRTPTKGIKELYDIAKVRIIDKLEKELRNGNTSSTLFDELYEFYTDLLVYDFNSLAIGVARDVYDKIKVYEHNNPAHLVDKEKLFFLIALLNTSTGNTITSTAYWELTLKEANRVNRNINNIGNIINQMPARFTSLIDAAKLRHDNNPLISSILNYNFIENFENNLNRLTSLHLLSFLASGLRNVHVNTFFDLYQQRIEVINMYGQELINNLSIINEAELKQIAQIQTAIPQAHKRTIGPMIQKISTFNTGVHAVLGNPFTNGAITKSGLYINSRFDFSSDPMFNNNYPNLINDIESGNLADDELKAYILYGIHGLRNRVLHDLNPRLVYYTDIDLFLKTIGLLFAGISVVKSL
tara:strand:+ start:74855 stop:76009 length:1155 start_codon:yes stop_codon:yes gene_type:complete